MGIDDRLQLELQLIAIDRKAEIRLDRRARDAARPNGRHERCKRTAAAATRRAQ